MFRCPISIKSISCFYTFMQRRNGQVLCNQTVEENVCWVVPVTLTWFRSFRYSANNNKSLIPISPHVDNVRTICCFHIKVKDMILYLVGSLQGVSRGDTLGQVEVLRQQEKEACVWGCGAGAAAFLPHNLHKTNEWFPLCNQTLWDQEAHQSVED